MKAEIRIQEQKPEWRRRMTPVIPHSAGPSSIPVSRQSAILKPVSLPKKRIDCSIGLHFWVQLEVGLSCLPPLSERIGPKNKNATDSTNSTDSISLADETFELERPASVHD